MIESASPASMRMIEEVREAMRVHEISEYGEDRLPAGPSIHTSDAIIVVEGRSDVLNLLKYGIKNTVAVEGVSVPQSIGNLSKKRTTTAFVVEDLEKDEVLVALRDKVPTAQFLANHNILSESDSKNSHKKHNGKHNNKHSNNKHQQHETKVKEEVQIEEIPIEDDETKLMKDMLKEFECSGCGAILDEALNMTQEVEVENIYEEIKNIETSADTVIFDGIISQRLVDVASLKGIKRLVAFRSMNIVKKPDNLKIITMD